MDIGIIDPFHHHNIIVITISLPRQNHYLALQYRKAVVVVVVENKYIINLGKRWN